MGYVKSEANTTNSRLSVMQNEAYTLLVYVCMFIIRRVLNLCRLIHLLHFLVWTVLSTLKDYLNAKHAIAEEWQAFKINLYAICKH